MGQLISTDPARFAACECSRGIAGRMTPESISGNLLIIDAHPIVAEAIGSFLESRYRAVRSVCMPSIAAALAHQADWLRIFVSVSTPEDCAQLWTLGVLGLMQRCCVLGDNDDTHLIRQLRAARSLGYLSKRLPVQSFVDGLERVIHGLPIFPAGSPGSEPAAPLPLSQRQIALLRMLQRGLENKRIAHELHLAEGTVKNQMYFLMRHLQVRNRTQAVQRAIELGIL